MDELENVGSQNIFIPLGPWRKGEKHCRCEEGTWRTCIEHCRGSTRRSHLWHAAHKRSYAYSWYASTFERVCIYFFFTTHIEIASIYSSDGYPAHVVDMWISEAQKEMREMRVRLYTRWAFAWAERKWDRCVLVCLLWSRSLYPTKLHVICNRRMEVSGMNFVVWVSLYGFGITKASWIWQFYNRCPSSHAYTARCTDCNRRYQLYYRVAV